MRRVTHVGKVLDGVDPDKSGGAKVQVNDLVDGGALDDESYVPGRFPFAGNGEGFYLPPQVGALLEVEVVDDEEEAVEELSARWVGMLYSNADRIPEEFRSNATKRGGIKFGEEVLLFDRELAILALISENVRLGEEAASHPVIRGDSFNSEFSTFLDGLSALATQMEATFAALAAAATGPLAPLATAFGQGQAAWATFKPKPAALKSAATSWLSTRVRTE
jgi:hypothetical protein